jgi:uncharacterized protein (UPF0332 family)
MSGKSLDWRYAIVYNAALQAARALIYSEGYRPASEKSHVSAIEYLKTRKEKEVLQMVGLLDSLRKRRHVAVYGVVGTISETSARNAAKVGDEVRGDGGQDIGAKEREHGRL